MEKRIISWVDIPATNIERAVKFYNSVFGMNLQSIDYGEEKMACFPTGEGAISEAPGFKPGKDGTMVSLNVEGNIDETVEKIISAGGEIVRSKTKIDAESRGYFAIFIDSEGNKVGIYGER